MAVGMRVRMIRGERTMTFGKGKGGVPVVSTGKNGGPIIQQVVVKHFTPKEAS